MRGSWIATAGAVCLAALVAVGARAETLDAVLAGCVPCHGEDGIARDSEVPHLAGQNEIYLANQIRAFRSGERVHPEMAFMTQDMADATIEALAVYYSMLPARP
ncbi:MAG TPA: cytochrome c [Methylomirabilota bacterium]|nr:cytochrome c [Methylomirabilota bacterium]